MEEVKKDTGNKAKRSKYDHVKQVATAYLQRRNYPFFPVNNINAEDFILESLTENEISRPNSILYSCFNNDPLLIDQMFNKFLTCLKDSIKSNKSYEDLEYLVGPIFCHMYLEILRGGHGERAANFFKTNLSTVDKGKCDNSVKDLINAYASDSIEAVALKDNFRNNKYHVQLSTESVRYLKKFLAEAGHAVLLQIFQNWFTIEENQLHNEREVMETEMITANDYLCNGHVETSKSKTSDVQKLCDVINVIKKDIAPIYAVNISNVKDEITCGSLSRKNGLFAYSYNNAIQLRSLQTLQQLPNTLAFGEIVLHGHSGRIYTMVIFDSYLISGSQDKTIRLFNIDDFKMRNVYKGHEYPVYCLANSKNGAYFASGSYDRTARLWSIHRKDTLRLFAGHTQQITSVDFHCNCTYLATGSSDRNVRMWSIKDADPIRLLLGSKGAIFALRFTPKGQYLLTSGEDRRLRIWDIVSAKQLAEIKTGPQPIIKIAISEDETLCATGSIDGTVKIWNLASILKNTGDPNLNESVQSLSLTPKLLSLDFGFQTFGCLTAQYNCAI